MAKGSEKAPTVRAIFKEYKIYFQGMHTSEILADIPDILGKVRPVECNRNSSLCHHRESPGPTSLSFKVFRNI